MLRLQYHDDDGTIYVYRGKKKGFGPLTESTPALYDSQLTAVGAKGAIMRGWQRTKKPLHEINIVSHPDGTPPARYIVQENPRTGEAAPCCKSDHERAMGIRRERLGRL